MMLEEKYLNDMYVMPYAKDGYMYMCVNITYLGLSRAHICNMSLNLLAIHILFNSHAWIASS